MSAEPEIPKSTIPFTDFGGSGPLIHFAHANGYPPECYAPLMDQLNPGFRVIAAHHRTLWHPGHAEFRSWVQSAEDLIRFLDEHGHKNIIGMGHSYGGVVSMLAAARRPDLFSQLVLLDPVFLTPGIAFFWGLSPNWLKKRVLPFHNAAMRRRDSWSDKETAFKHFRSKPVFARMTDHDLDAMVNGLLKPKQGGGFTLRQSKLWEAKLYLTMPNYIWKELKKVKTPTLGIRGYHSDTVFAHTMQAWREAQPGVVQAEIADGGHLFPMERPKKTAVHILSFLNP